MNKRGLTLVELLVTLAVFWIALVLAAPGLQSFFARMEMQAALRCVTAGLGAARIAAIRDNRPVRVEVEAGRLLLRQEGAGGWSEIRRFELGGGVTAAANGRPVFSPLGFASPLCTITLARGGRSCRVVLSMYGRVRVEERP